MKKISIPLIIFLIGAVKCFPQSSDSSGHTEPWPGCQAYFTFYFNDSIKTFVEAYPYRFISQPEGNTVEWKWDFGDGQTSSEPNPMHFYSHAGDSVTVCLTTTTSDGCISIFCDMFIVGSNPFPPDCANHFDILVMESYPPVYRFIPDRMQNQESFFWDFGDGSYSSEVSPTHKYEYSGTYNVCLQSTNSSGCSANSCKTLQATGYNKECKAAWKALSDIFIDSTGTGIPDSSFSPLAGNYYFQDLSRGSVMQWKWNFGDGTVSGEQNPVHAYVRNGIYHVCLDIMTTDSCRSTFCDTLYVGVVPYCSLTGTVLDYTGLDGCGLLIQLDNGEVLEPAEVVPDFKLKNGQRVRLAYTELRDRASICMVGKIVRIDCIGELSTDYCQAAFTHYPLPWVSSLPPLYQFEYSSAGEVTEITWDMGDGTVTNEISPTHRYPYSGLYTVCLTVYTKDGCTSTSCETSYYEGADQQPGLCDHFIKLNTEIILNGQICNGSASAGLVDGEGRPVYVMDYLWSTGETGPEIRDLCPGITYSVIVADSTGCALSGSFSFGGNVTAPDSLFGFWNFQQNDKDFIFNIPVYSDSVYCEWDFGDGETGGGSSVNHTYDSGMEQMVILKVYDLNGKILYNQQIPVTPGTPTRLRKLTEASLEVYPIPATDVLYMNLLSDHGGAQKVEILTSNGQLVYISSVLRQDANILQLDVSGLPAGFYIGKLVYKNGMQQPFRFVK